MGFDLSQMEQADLIHLHWIGGRTLDFSRLGRIRRPLVHTLHDLFACTAGCHCPLECTGFHEGCRGKCPQLGTPRLFPGLPAWLFDRKKKAFGSIRSLTLVTPSRWLRQQVEKAACFPAGASYKSTTPWIRRSSIRQRTGRPKGSKWASIRKPSSLRAALRACSILSKAAALFLSSWTNCTAAATGTST